MCAPHVVCVSVRGCALHCSVIWLYRTYSLVYTITEMNLLTQHIRIETHTTHTHTHTKLLSPFLCYLSFSHNPIHSLSLSLTLSLYLLVTGVRVECIRTLIYTHTRCTRQWCPGIPRMSPGQLETAACDRWMNERGMNTLWEHQELISERERQRWREKQKKEKGRVIKQKRG